MAVPGVFNCSLRGNGEKEFWWLKVVKTIILNLQEKQSAKADLLNLQKAMADLEAREQQDKVEKEKLQR